MEANTHLINFLVLITTLVVMVFGDEKQETENESEQHAYNRYAVADKITNGINGRY